MPTNNHVRDRGGNGVRLVHIGATAFIGVDVQDTQDGVAVSDIIAGTPAQQAGLQQGDLLTSLDGTPITTTDDLRNALFSHHPTTS